MHSDTGLFLQNMRKWHCLEPVTVYPKGKEGNLIETRLARLILILCHRWFTKKLLYLPHTAHLNQVPAALLHTFCCRCPTGVLLFIGFELKQSLWGVAVHLFSQVEQWQYRREIWMTTKSGTDNHSVWQDKGDGQSVLAVDHTYGHEGRKCLTNASSV